MKRLLNKRQVAGMVKGGVMILFGTALLLSPQFTLVSIVRFIGVLLLVKGILSGFVVLFSKSSGTKPSLAFEAIVDLVIGLLFLYHPGGTISFLVIVLAIWALLGGLLLSFSFNSLRRVGVTNWGLFLNSIVALSFGLALLFEPLRGGLALATVIGIFAILYGLFSLFSIFGGGRR